MVKLMKNLFFICVFSYYCIWEILLEYFTKYGGSLHISDLKWDSGVADIILEGLRELHQAVGNINDDIENGNYKKL